MKQAEFRAASVWAALASLSRCVGLMDIAATLGLVMAVTFMLVAVILGGGSLGTFYDPPSVIVTIGGSFAVTAMMFPLRVFLALPSNLFKLFFHRRTDLSRVVRQMIELSEMARRDGVLELERKLPEINNPYITIGVQMVVDNAPPEIVERVLQSEMDALLARSRDFKAFLQQLGSMGPAFGLIGTLLGLILMLGNLTNPDALGPGMAVAMMTTLYGAVIANVFAIPLVEKLSYNLRHESLCIEAVIYGILAIQNGDGPRKVEQQLTPYTKYQKAA
jgi:chemotaxis protein MotA